jgi:hypothetical protein
VDIGEVRFEKTYTVDLDGMRALTHVLHARRGRIGALLGGFVIVLSIFMFLLDARDLHAVLSLILGLIGLVYGVLFTRIVASRSLKKQRSLLVPTLRRFGEDGFSIESGTSYFATRYADIQRIALARGYALLFATDITATIIPLSDFDVGDPARFLGFLEKKTGIIVERVGK